MNSDNRDWAAELVHFWFRELDSTDWYNGSARVDDILRERFAGDLTQLADGDSADFLTDPKTAQAAILLFDQVPRNIHRKSALAFASDPLARAITDGVIERGWLATFAERERQFVLMPLMHSEQLADQDLSVALFEQHAPGALPFAQSHREMIARFGRFPHRNNVLGRETTTEEQAAIDSGFSW
ncbi:DUF924 family protein [Qipengyuania marisflavi]|uniref:DUF924 family protein n=1 Tax=Qipengyuania marisflavi TaxID=2486356 RepID=UPI001FECD277|nr:DUF924 family protein [Qipengyuania marisflavi]